MEQIKYHWNGSIIMCRNIVAIKKTYDDNWFNTIVWKKIRVQTVAPESRVHKCFFDKKLSFSIGEWSEAWLIVVA